ncbi:MAG: metal-sensing transcriptional repressor [Erysipelotrichaceae bacterium]|nr:metal-sensing transcriptional repressor [Erysipelotrichaceae bacterium]
MIREREKALQNLKTARGQIDAIIRMIEDERYCIDVSNQIMASTALLKKASMHILSGHLHTCVKDAMRSEEQSEEKINEIEVLLEKILK